MCIVVFARVFLMSRASVFETSRCGLVKAFRAVARFQLFNCGTCSSVYTLKRRDVSAGDRKVLMQTQACGKSETGRYDKAGRIQACCLHVTLQIAYSLILLFVGATSLWARMGKPKYIRGNQKGEGQIARYITTSSPFDLMQPPRANEHRRRLKPVHLTSFGHIIFNSTR